MKIGRMAQLGEVFNLNPDIESHKQSVSLLNPLHPVPKIRTKNMTCHEIQEEKAGSTDEGSDEEHWQLESNSSEIKFDNSKPSRTYVRDYNLMAASQVFLFPALGGLLFGYDIGATSAVVSQLESIYSGVKWSSAVVNSSSLQGIITAMSTLGALIGSIACFRLADLLGRKKSLLIASFLYLCGAALEIISGDPNWNAVSGIAVLLLGRLVYGFGIGFAMNGAPAYIGEMAPSAIRGIFIFFIDLFEFTGNNTLTGYQTKLRNFALTKGGFYCLRYHPRVYFWLHLLFECWRLEIHICTVDSICSGYVPWHAQATILSEMAGIERPYERGQIVSPVCQS